MWEQGREEMYQTRGRAVYVRLQVKSVRADQRKQDVTKTTGRLEEIAGKPAVK